MSEVNINVCNVRELVTASDCGAKVVAFTCRQLSIHSARPHCLDTAVHTVEKYSNIHSYESIEQSSETNIASAFPLPHLTQWYHPLPSTT
jgi:hypothetical protein